MTTLHRMLPLPSGKRIGLKLAPATWQAIEYLADRKARTWQQWCVEVLDGAGDDSDSNMTATIRDAAMSQLLAETAFGDRADQHAAMGSHPLIVGSGTMDDAGLDEALSKGEVSGRSDFGGFEVIFGFDEFGQDSVWIRNGLRHGLHVAFVVPSDLSRSGGCQ